MHTKRHRLDMAVLSLGNVAWPQAPVLDLVTPTKFAESARKFSAPAGLLPI